MQWDDRCRQILERFLDLARVVSRHKWFWLTFADGPSQGITLYEDGKRPELVLALYRGANVGQARMLHAELGHPAFWGFLQRDTGWSVQPA